MRAMSVARDDLQVALLRGVNVGGKNKLPLKQLATLFERCGRDLRAD